MHRVRPDLGGWGWIWALLAVAIGASMPVAAGSDTQRLDTGFDPGANNQVRAFAIQADGKILVGGDFTTLGGGGGTGITTRNHIGRLNADGSLDTSFNPGVTGTVNALAVQADGKILVGGIFSTLGGGGVGTTARNGLGRLNADGSLDTSFNPGLWYVTAIAVQADGKFVVVGEHEAVNHLGRFNADGSLDASFTPPVANNDVNAVAVQADGKILVGGAFTTLGGATRNYIGRLNANGSLDTSFNPGADGFPGVYALAVQADGKIVVGGRFTGLGGGTGTTTRYRIGRLNADGSLDTNFNPGTDGDVNALVLQEDGKIVVGGFFWRLGGGGCPGPNHADCDQTGTTSRAFIGRVNADGSLDTSFNPGAGNVVNVLAVQADGKVLVGGAFTTLGGAPRNYIGRLLVDPSAPSVTTHPSNQTVTAGATASFSSAASGNPAPTVQWQVSTNGGSSFTNISGATAGTYSFVAGSADDGKQFRAVFTNSVGSATSNAATLTVPLPTIMSLDRPSSGSVVGRPFTTQGWALNQSALSGTGVDAIHVYAFPTDGSAASFLGVATYGVSRPDVGVMFGAQFTNSGFTLTSGAGLSPGGYVVVAYAHNALTNSFDVAKSASITIPPPVSIPSGAIYAPGAGSSVTGSFQVFGWSVDTGAASGTGIDAVRVYAFASGSATPIWLGVATYGDARGDVGAIFGSQFTNSGYHLTVNTLLAPGAYTLVVYSRSTVSGAFTPIVQTFTRVAGTVMSVDAPGAAATVTRPFLLTGWAIDRDAPSGPGVDTMHVWAFPSSGGAAIFVGVADVGGMRGDVGAIYGSQFAPSGYNLAVTTGSLAAGTYTLAVYAHSTVTGTFNQVKTLTITVQ